MGISATAAATAVFLSLVGSASWCVAEAAAVTAVAVLSVPTVDADAAAAATELTAAAGSNPASARALYMATAL